MYIVGKSQMDQVMIKKYICFNIEFDENKLG